MIFVDTSFWVAVRNRRDANHEAASTLLATHAAGGLVTTNHVVGETCTFLRRRAGHASAVEFLDVMDRSPRATVTRVSAVNEERALRWLRRHDEREYSFVDATSFLMMKEERITEALAFDGDFNAAGFVELRP